MDDAAGSIGSERTPQPIGIEVPAMLGTLQPAIGVLLTASFAVKVPLLSTGHHGYQRIPPRRPPDVHRQVVMPRGESIPPLGPRLIAGAKSAATSVRSPETAAESAFTSRRLLASQREPRLPARLGPIGDRQPTAVRSHLRIADREPMAVAPSPAASGGEASAMLACFGRCQRQIDGCKEAGPTGQSTTQPLPLRR